MRNSFKGRRRVIGFTLIEVLVALLVVSVGLLGVAALHSVSLRNNYDALMRSHASALAGDIADRMRVNRAEVNVTSDYNIEMSEELEIDDDSSQAAIDVMQWKDTMAAQLPDGKGAIAIKADGIVTISIRWGERGSDIEFQTETVI
jgi:type IV pilus assembly protein PilV